MTDTRRKVLLGVAGVVVAAALAVGGYLLWQKNADPYAGMTLWRETQIDDATRALLEQRIATTEASIAVQEAEDGAAEADLYLSLANDAHILGDLVKTREALEKLLNENPIMHAAWNMYGNVLSRMGDLEPAEKAYLEAIEINPSAEYYMDFVTFLDKYYPERDEEMLLTLEHAVAVLGQRSEFMVALAEWYRSHSECAKAIDHYKVAQTLSPENTAIADDLAATRATCVEAE
ncbi:tetratricopeptide repeat protein [Candidatus Uhrbacteria bacterium]|nr:tetratricopeptide repeat protein [Candidatus Uhrbacteria bacterium]